MATAAMEVYAIATHKPAGDYVRAAVLKHTPAYFPGAGAGLPNRYTTELYGRIRGTYSSTSLSVVAASADCYLESAHVRERTCV
jgi:hypothetical protein